jgi:uncharacterized protein YydD (DUF2326 family)
VIHRIYSDLPTFKNLELHGGLNVLLAERHNTATERQTRNRAGKSSLVQIIHFLMGSSADRASLFRQEALREYKFGLVLDLPGGQVTVERKGSQYGHIVIREGDTSAWPIQPSMRRDVGRRLSRQDWCSVLGDVFFGMAVTDDRIPDSFRPTFRSVFSYFVRRERDGGFHVPQAHATIQQTWDQQVAVAFLLGLDWTIPQAWEMVRQREKALTQLKKAAAQGALGGIISSSAELRTQLVIAEQASERLNQALGQFQVLAEYRELEQEASHITRTMNELSNQNTLDEQLLEDLNGALASEQPPEMAAVSRLYEEAGVALPTMVSRRFEEVRAFHESIIANRRSYLSSEVSSAEERLGRRRREMTGLDTRRAEIMRVLQSRGALDQFQHLQQEASRQQAETETIRQRFQAAEQLEGASTELEIERARLVQRLRRDLDEQGARVREAITTFESVSRALYEDEHAGSLTLEPTNNGLNLEIRIQGQGSRGIQNMQVFCFDLMLMKLCSARRIGPRFLVHDSHLFDGVDERQVARALQLGAETAEACGWQYLVTLNSDDVPTSFPGQFNFAQHILPVTLTDQTENGGLFGFRF